MATPTYRQRFLDFFFPRSCPVCGTRLAIGERFVCPACLRTLPYEVLECDWTMNRHVLRWQGEHPALERMGALCVYRRDNAAARLIHELKFWRHYELGLWMGRLAAQTRKAEGLFEDVDALVPLPLAPSRRRQRGFNQAEAIARGMGEVLGIPVQTDLLRRVAARESQTHFRLADRFRNGQNLFVLTEGVQPLGRHLMLVDDVLTTGSTMMSAVGTLEVLPEVRISTFSWAWVNLSAELWIQARRDSET